MASSSGTDKVFLVVLAVLGVLIGANALERILKATGHMDGKGKAS